MSKVIKKILVVEDDKALQKVLVGMLKDEHFSVTSAEDGEAAIQLLKKHDQDLVLLDVVMPNMDGFRTLEEIREENISTPVIMLSNLSQEEEKNKAKKLGAVDYIVKSDTTLAEIVEKIKHLG